jgi:fused signal recognition particle receptor
MFTFFKNKIKKVLSAFTKKSFAIGGKIRNLFSKNIDESSFEELEELFYEADLGCEASLELVDHLRSLKKKNSSLQSEDYLSHIRTYLLNLLQKSERPPLGSPHIILVVGVNGSGKTTSVAKLAKLYQNQGLKVLLAAGDTFRAAAIDQLCHWAEKLNIDIIKSQPNGDPAAIAFDAISKAEAKEYDIVIIDTAGRLQTKTELMGELEKVKRVCQKKNPNYPHETFLVVDATCGQNAIDQTNIFHKHTPLNGLILTKLDGSAKGGVVVSIFKNTKIPIHYIGVGEKEDDLLPFNPQEFVDALLQSTD